MMAFKKIMILFLIGILFIGIINNVYSLKIMEPVIDDLQYKSVVDIGLTSPGEQIMVSFFQGVNGEFSEIRLANESRDIAIIENTRYTKESIFTTINIKENVSGTKNIELYLIGATERKITLRTTITNEVIYAYILPYNKISKIEEPKKILIRVINKAASTKEIIISSDLSKHNFSEEIKQNKRILLQPNSVTDVSYEFIPNMVGLKNHNLYLFLDTSKRVQIIDETTTDIIIKEIEIEIPKTLNNIQKTNKNTFTLYGLNILPVHFFNNFIRYLIN
jgi:hypothetical protein